MTAGANDRSAFSRWLQRAHPDLNAAAAKRLFEFGDLVADSADRLGLVASGDRSRLYMRHLREALAPPVLDAIPEGARVLDVGSGGGFPAVPVAIVRDDLRLTLTEPREKKAAFLQRVVLALGLTGVVLFPGTLEDLGRRTDAPSWDVALSRAIRWTPRMVRALGGMLPEEGTVIRYGARSGTPPGVAVHVLEDTDRAVQIWPRSHWAMLTAAR